MMAGVPFPMPNRDHGFETSDSRTTSDTLCRRLEYAVEMLLCMEKAQTRGSRMSEVARPFLLKEAVAVKYKDCGSGQSARR